MSRPTKHTTNEMISNHIGGKIVVCVWFMYLERRILVKDAFKWCTSKGITEKNTNCKVV